MNSSGREIGRELANETRCFLASPAGYGKTYAIAEAVKMAAPIQGRQLILTHTHAGVHSLQEKLKKLGVSKPAWHVETIAGWALKYASAYKKTSGLAEIPVGKAWETVYPAAVKCLKLGPIRDVLTNTYGGVFVDEYQDCTLEQHALILSIADLLPCRVLGDPLQGIFDFAGPCVDLTSGLDTFASLEPLAVPYRWLNDNNHPLAEWLFDARNKLLIGAAIEISHPAVHIPLDPTQLRITSLQRLSSKESVVVAHQFPPQSHQFAKGSGGRYKSMEEMDCFALIAFAKTLDQSNGAQRAIALIDHAGCMLSNVMTILNPMKGALQKKKFNPHRYSKVPSVAQALSQFEQDDGPQSLLNTFDLFNGMSGANLFRRELSRETRRMLDAMTTDKYPTYEEAALGIRERTRRIGRPTERLTSSRILLIKGLEYKHCIVVNADALNTRELYVALTRGSKSLTVQSAKRSLQPSS